MIEFIYLILIFCYSGFCFYFATKNFARKNPFLYIFYCSLGLILLSLLTWLTQDSLSESNIPTKSKIQSSSESQIKEYSPESKEKIEILEENYSEKNLKENLSTKEKFKKL